MFTKLLTVYLVAFTVVVNGSLAAPTEAITLHFRSASTPDGAKEPKGEDDKEKKKFRGSLSAVAFAANGKALFLGGDETVEKEPSIELLTRKEDGSYGNHQSLLLSSFIPLPDPTVDEGRVGEIDIEALAVKGGYLWIAGSHSCNRKRPSPDDPPSKGLKKLAAVEEGKNRFFLGRIPIADDPQTGVKLVKENGNRKAGRLTGSDKDWNLLTELANDAHFGPYLAPFKSDGKIVRLPSKDNGLDIEGLAVEHDRLFLGLRGPVLRGWACILEIKVKDKGSDGDFELEGLNGAAPKSPRYHKHFLDLDGLGIRDLHADGENLYILSGPTMAMDGPARLTLWEGAFKAMAGGDTVTHSETNGLGKPKDLMVGTGHDHPEGIALLQNTASGPQKMVIVYDSPAASRFEGDTNVKADVLSLP